MNSIEKKMAELGHLRFSFERGRFIWFALQAGVVDYKYKFIRDLEALNRTTLMTQQPVAVFVDGEESKALEKTVKQFPRWRQLMVGGRGLATETPMTVCAKTVSLVVAYGDAEWTDALRNHCYELESPPDVICREMVAVPIEQMPLTKSDGNGRYHGDVERLRHWWRTPAIGLQVRDMIDMRPQFRV